LTELCRFLTYLWNNPRRIPVDGSRGGVQTLLESSSSESGVVCYELMASVCHIRDKQAGGNLVAHVLAGERYHKRKEGVTHKTWYLFNDFAITPIEKVMFVHIYLLCYLE